MKSRPEDFAIFGGPPAFTEPLHVGRPNLGDRQALHERIDAMLDRRWLTNDGPLVREFEATVAEVVGVDHCVAASSGTTALELLVRSAALEGEVIVPSFTFVGTAHAMLWSGLRPRFCDVGADSHMIDPAKLSEVLSDETAAIVGVHLWGLPCDTEQLTEIARDAGVPLFFDAAHAFGSAHSGTMIGGFGDAEVFSFHATKIVNSLEGGAITTNDAELAERARLLRNFGFADYDTVSALGTNGKMSEASAAVGLTSLESLDRFLAANKSHYEHYRDALGGLAGLKLVGTDATPGSCNRQYVVIELIPDHAGLTRDDLLDLLWAEGVLARRYFYPGVHAGEPYNSLDPDAGKRLPVTEALAERVLCLPTGTALREPEVAAICELIADAFAHGKAIRSRLER